MNKKILVIGFWQDGIEKLKNVVCYPDYYRPVKGIDKLLFKIRRHLQLFGGVTGYLGDWTAENFDCYDYIFLGEGFEDRATIEYIRRRSPKAKIILYYVNHFDDDTSNHPKMVKDLVSEIYSFDYGNAKKEQLKFKPFFYPYEAMVRDVTANTSVQNDVYFCGGDKGRYKKLCNILDCFTKLGLACKFVVVKTKRHGTYNKKLPVVGSEISYEEILQGILESKAILEINVEGQDGITLRAMESFFCERKLITENFAVRNYDFYDERNMFLLGGRPLDELPGFLKDKFYPVADDIKKRYSFNEWFKDFFEE